MTARTETVADVLLARTGAGCSDRRQWNRNRSCPERFPSSPRAWCLTCLSRATAEGLQHRSAAESSAAGARLLGRLLVAGAALVVMVSAVYLWAVAS